MLRGSVVLGLCQCRMVLVGVEGWRGVCHFDVQVGCVFLVEVERGKLVCGAIGLCKGVT